MTDYEQAINYKVMYKYVNIMDVEFDILMNSCVHMGCLQI